MYVANNLAFKINREVASFESKVEQYDNLDLFRLPTYRQPLSKTPLENYKCIDLFAGIRGIRIPFEELGAKFVFASEYDKFCQKTYQLKGLS